MGLFSSSKKSTTQNITTNTTTETNIRDIGLSGAAAVDLAEVLQFGAVESEAIRASSFDKLVQQSGSNYNQLIGGASNLIETVAETSRDLMQGTEKQAANSSNMISNAAQDAQNTIRKLADRATDSESDMVKALPYIAVVAIGVFAFTNRS